MVGSVAQVSSDDRFQGVAPTEASVTAVLVQISRLKVSLRRCSVSRMANLFTRCSELISAYRRGLAPFIRQVGVRMCRLSR